MSVGDAGSKTPEVRSPLSKSLLEGEEHLGPVTWEEHSIGSLNEEAAEVSQSIASVSGRRMNRESLATNPAKITKHETGEPRVIQKTPWKEPFRAIWRSIKIAWNIGISPTQKQVMNKISKAVDFAGKSRTSVDIDKLCKEIIGEGDARKANLAAFRELLDSNNHLIELVLGKEGARNLAFAIFRQGGAT